MFTIFTNGSIIPPGFKFTELHALTLAARSYALLLARMTYLCALGVLFLVLEEEEEGVARGAVFLGTTFSSLYRVVGESGTWWKQRQKQHTNHTMTM